MSIALLRPYLSKALKDEDLPMDYNWIPQMNKKITTPRTAPAVSRCLQPELVPQILAYGACFASIGRFVW
jgi:hypothetical protein